MSNYFEYQDFAAVDKLKMSVSATGVELQTGASIEHLKRDLIAYDYASFEKDAYITSNPKHFATETKKLGFLPKVVSNENGNMSIAFTITIESPVLLSGITLWCINKLKAVRITYKDEHLSIIRQETFGSDYITDNIQFFNMVGESVKFIDIQISGTQKPYHFLGIYRIDFGAARIFDDTNLIDAKVSTYYRLDGTTIEYDVLQANVFHEEDTEYGFSKKQVIFYKDSEGKTINKFYVDKGEQSTDNVVSFKAYDNISLLEGVFLGGKYGFGRAEPYPVKTLLADILDGTGVEYTTAGIDEIFVTGYIPICTKRKALSLICKGANIRCSKLGGNLIFEPLNFGNNIEYSNNEIIENPSIERKEKVGQLTVIEHNYEISNEEIELFNWYLQQGENTEQIIEFSEPVWKVVPYEVIGVDPETGLDIISDTVSDNVTFLEYPSKTNNICNYVKIGRLSTSNKVILKGYKISDGQVNVTASRGSLSDNVEYDQIVIEDITVVKSTIENGKNIKQTQEIANTLFSIESTSVKQTFEVVNVDMPVVGSNVTTSLVESPITITVADKSGNITDITRSIKITSVTDDLSGVYKVVAE